MIAALLVLVPLVAAVAVAFAPRPAVHRPLAVAGALATFALTLFADGASFTRPWIAALGSDLAFAADGAGLVLVRVAAAVMSVTLVWALARVDTHPHRAAAWLLATLAGLAGIFTARDLLVFYVFWELTLLPALALLAGWGLAHRRAAVVKYLLYAVVGSFAMLLSVLAIRPLSGASGYGFDALAAAAGSLDALTQTWLFAGFAVAFAVKLPIFPLHAWLIDVHEQNHPSGVADVAGTLYKVGGFGLFAVAIPLLPAGAAAFAPVGLALGAFTAVLGAVIAVKQGHLKRLLAYASLSHMGVVAVGLFSLQTAGMAGAMALLAAQMVTTGGLFLLSGMLFDRRGTFEVAAYGGLARSAPFLSSFALIVLFASVGVPGLANFPGEFLALLGAYAASPAAAVVAVLAVIAAGALAVNLNARVFQGPATAAVPDLRGIEIAVLAPILALTLWLGVAPAAGLAAIEAQIVAAPLASPPLAAPVDLVGGAP